MPTRPYFVKKARAVLNRMSAAPDADPIPLAQWAEHWRETSHPLVVVGALVTAGGEIVATTRLVRGHLSTYYVDEVGERLDELHPGAVRDLVTDLAESRASSLLGEPVRHVKVWEVATGRAVQ